MLWVSFQRDLEFWKCTGQGQVQGQTLVTKGVKDCLWGVTRMPERNKKKEKHGREKEKVRRE